MPKSVPAIPDAPRPMGPYSTVTEANGFVFLSGQVALDHSGRALSGDVIEQTKVVLDRIGRILAGLGLRYEDVVKTTLFLADVADFGRVNEVYREYFDSDPPARTTVQAGALPGSGTRIEIEVIAAR